MKDSLKNSQIHRYQIEFFSQPFERPKMFPNRHEILEKEREREKSVKLISDVLHNALKRARAYRIVKANDAESF